MSCHRNSMMTTRFSSPLIKPDVPISSIRLPDGLHVQPTQGVSTPLQPHDAEFSIDYLRGKPSRPTTPVALMSPPQKVPDSIIDVGVNLPICLVQAPIAEVRFPSPQLLVQLVAHFLPGAYLTRLQQIINRPLEFPDRLIGWPCCRVPPAIFPMPHGSECVTQKVKRFPSGILDARLGFIQCQADPAHHLTRPFPCLRRMSATENHEVSSPGESHPEALSEPYLNLSAHTAPVVEPRRTPNCQCAHNFGSRLEIRATQCVALRKWPRSFLYFR